MATPYNGSQMKNLILNNTEGLEMPPVRKEVKKRTWRWIGHVFRMPANESLRKAVNYLLAGRRSLGRPRIT